MAIYDCFTFNNELEMLDIRMHYLDPYVDYFVIVEMPRTHRGEKKPLYFQANRDKYEKFEKKIIYYAPNDEEIPQYKHDGDWTVENFQRNCIVRGIKKCYPDDVIMISDVDEIPNICYVLKKNTMISLNSEKNKYLSKRKKILYAAFMGKRSFIRALKNQVSVSEILEDSPISCEQDLFYYFLNCKSEGKWYGTIVTKYKNLAMPQYLRDRRNMYPSVKNGGWHFSYVGGVEQIKAKLKTIIDNNTSIIQKAKIYENDEDYIFHCIQNGIDIYGRETRENIYHFIDPSEVGLWNNNEIMELYPHFYHMKH